MTEQDIYEETRNAYSHDRYGKVAWKNAITLLIAAGYTSEQVVEILCSKYMRWAADSFSQQVGEVEEVCDGTEIMQYGAKWGIDINALVCGE